MARSCSIADAKNHLPRLVHEVERGSPVELNRRGRPVAILLSMEQFRILSGRSEGFGKAARRFLREVPAARGAIDGRFLRGVRDRSPGRKSPL